MQSLILGASIHSEDQRQQMDNNLPIPEKFNKSHSDGEIVTSNSQDLNEVNYQPSYNAYSNEVSFDADSSRKSSDLGPSPQVFVSEVGSVAASMANSFTPQESPIHRGSTDGSQSSVSLGSAAELARDQRKSGDIKKSFNTAFTNFSKFTEKVKQNVKQDLLNIDDSVISDDWDTVSIKSGASSDDEEFVVLKLANEKEVPAFERRHSMSETASVSAGSDSRDMDSASIHLGSASERARGVVSVKI